MNNRFVGSIFLWLCSCVLADLVFTVSAKADIAYAWGENTYGQVGDGTKSNIRNLPVPVTTLGNAVTSVATGGTFSFAIENGALYSWGLGNHGQLGIGTQSQHVRPVQITSLNSGVTALAGGLFHSVAVVNGGVYTWGDNTYYQLGDGTKNESDFPMALSSLSSGVTSIACGIFTNLATQNGAVYAWGDVDVAGTPLPTPTPVSGLSSGVTAIATEGGNQGQRGYSHNFAIKNGALYAWGTNAYSNNVGILGDGTTTNRPTPVPVNTLTSGVTSVATGVSHAIAVKDGFVYAWGADLDPQGQNNSIGSLIPRLIDPTELNNVVKIAATSYSSYALTADGSLWAWGYNSLGEVGQGTIDAAYYSPHRVLAPAGYLFTSVSSSGSGHQVVTTIAPIPDPYSLSLITLFSVGLLHRRRMMRFSKPTKK